MNIIYKELYKIILFKINVDIIFYKEYFLFETNIPIHRRKKKIEFN